MGTTWVLELEPDEWILNVPLREALDRNDLALELHECLCVHLGNPIWKAYGLDVDLKLRTKGSRPNGDRYPVDVIFAEACFVRARCFCDELSDFAADVAERASQTALCLVWSSFACQTEPAPFVEVQNDSWHGLSWLVVKGRSFEQ